MDMILSILISVPAGIITSSARADLQSVCNLQGLKITRLA